MPNTKAYTSSHQTFLGRKWADVHDFIMLQLWPNHCSQGPSHTEWCQQHQRACLYEVWARTTLTNVTPGALIGKVTGKWSAVSHTRQRGRIQHSGWMTVPAKKVINRRVCSTLILPYLSPDFKEKASLNTSRSQKSSASSSKFHTGEKSHDYCIRGFSRKQEMQQHPETTHTRMSNKSQTMKFLHELSLILQQNVNICHVDNNCHVSIVFQTYSPWLKRREAKAQSADA